MAINILFLLMETYPYKTQDSGTLEFQIINNSSLLQNCKNCYEIMIWQQSLGIWLSSTFLYKTEWSRNFLYWKTGQCTKKEPLESRLLSTLYDVWMHLGMGDWLWLLHSSICFYAVTLMFLVSDVYFTLTPVDACHIEFPFSLSSSWLSLM